MPNFELLYAKLDDLALGDPMRPAAITHVLGDDAKACYNLIQSTYSLYEIGRGQLPPEVGKDGYFFVASKPDYPVLQTALADLWPDMPDFPSYFGGNRADHPVYSQEIADMKNYIAKPPLRDHNIFREARKQLKGLIPKQYLIATARVAEWLVENMKPANNCFALSALFARWLKEHGALAEYREGHATLRHPHHPVSIPHAWVDVDGEKCDLTVNRQSAWGELSGSMARIRVSNPRIVYQIADVNKYKSLENFWRVYSKPPGRPAYTEASLKRQSVMIREIVPPSLYIERRVWIDLVREHGLLEGTYQLLTILFEGDK
jgi:hypothetical protein